MTFAEAESILVILRPPLHALTIEQWNLYMTAVDVYTKYQALDTKKVEIISTATKIEEYPAPRSITRPLPPELE